MSKRHWPTAAPPVYGLGPPLNRPTVAPVAIAIRGRPNWFLIGGREVYVEPPAKPIT